MCVFRMSVVAAAAVHLARQVRIRWSAAYFTHSLLCLSYRIASPRCDLPVIKAPARCDGNDLDTEVGALHRLSRI